VAYKPLNKAEIEEGLRAEVLELPQDLHRYYEGVAVPVYEAGYADSREGPLVLVIAKSGNRVVFYDDVEDDFGIGTIEDGASLKDCSLTGELRLALLALRSG